MGYRYRERTTVWCVVMLCSVYGTGHGNGVRLDCIECKGRREPGSVSQLLYFTTTYACDRVMLSLSGVYISTKCFVTSSCSLLLGLAAA